MALGLHHTVRSFIATKFSGTEAEAGLATKAFTRGALGTGTFWNLSNCSPEIQLYWVRSMYTVQTNQGTRYDSKVKFKGSGNVKKFENLCRLNMVQIRQFMDNLEGLQDKYGLEVSQKVFASGQLPELQKAKTHMLNHKYHEQVFRNGEKKTLIPYLQTMLKTVETKLKVQAKIVKDAKDAQARVDALLKKKREMEEQKEAKERLEAARGEVKYMLTFCQSLQDDDQQDLAVTPELKTECSSFAEKVQVLIDGNIFESEDNDDLLELKRILKTTLGATIGKFVDHMPVDISYAIL